MRTSVVIALAIALAMIGITPASAAQEYWVRYESPALGQGDTITGCFDAPLSSCAVARVPVGATNVSIRIIDDIWPGAVYATVGQDLNDDGLTDQSTNICGSTTVPFPVMSEVPLGLAEIIVFPHALPGLGSDVWGGSPAPCGGFATRGWVVFTFS